MTSFARSLRPTSSRATKNSSKRSTTGTLSSTERSSKWAGPNTPTSPTRRNFLKGFVSDTPLQSRRAGGDPFRGDHLAWVLLPGRRLWSAPGMGGALERLYEFSVMLDMFLVVLGDFSK